MTMKTVAGRPKSDEKRRLILEAAKCLFLTNGIANVSMDLIAKEAGVSKQTVYSHFKNKDTLYSAAVASKLEHYHLDQIAEDGDNIDVVLQDIATKFVDLLHDPQVVAMYRVVIGDVSDNTKVQELFLNSGPKKLMLILADYLKHYYSLSEAQSLQQSLTFFNILKGDYHLRSLLGMPYFTSEEERAIIVSTAIDFLQVQNQP